MNMEGLSTYQVPQVLPSASGVTAHNKNLANIDVFFVHLEADLAPSQR